MPENVLRKVISWAELHELFVDISDKFGFIAEEYEDEITSLIELWEKQGYVEIYQQYSDRLYGRAKDSSLAQGASPYYIGLFHVRVVNGDNDPLAVLVFEEHQNDNGKVDIIASLRFMVDHSDLFGEEGNGEKFDPAFMRQLRKQIDSFVQEGSNHKPNEES